MRAAMPARLIFVRVRSLGDAHWAQRALETLARQHRTNSKERECCEKLRSDERSSCVAAVLISAEKLLCNLGFQPNDERCAELAAEHAAVESTCRLLRQRR